jgi:hypothetical protein
LGPDHPDVAQAQQSLEIARFELAEGVPGRASNPLILAVFEPRIGSGNPLATPMPHHPAARSATATAGAQGYPGSTLER